MALGTATSYERGVRAPIALGSTEFTRIPARHVSPDLGAAPSSSLLSGITLTRASSSMTAMLKEGSRGPRRGEHVLDQCLPSDFAPGWPQGRSWENKMIPRQCLRKWTNLGPPAAKLDQHGSKLGRIGQAEAKLRLMVLTTCTPEDPGGIYSHPFGLIHIRGHGEVRAHVSWYLGESLALGGTLEPMSVARPRRTLVSASGVDAAQPYSSTGRALHFLCLAQPGGDRRPRRMPLAYLNRVPKHGEGLRGMGRGPGTRSECFRVGGSPFPPTTLAMWGIGPPTRAVLPPQ